MQTDNDSYNMAELLKREWVEVSQRDSSLNELRVLSFNVLADGLSQVGAGHWVQTLTSLEAWELRQGRPCTARMGLKIPSIGL